MTDAPRDLDARIDAAMDAWLAVVNVPGSRSARDGFEAALNAAGLPEALARIAELEAETFAVTDEMVDLVLEPLHARYALVGQDYADVRVAPEALSLRTESENAS